LLTIDPINVPSQSRIAFEVAKDIGENGGRSESAGSQRPTSYPIELQVTLELQQSINVFLHGPSQIRVSDCEVRAGGAFSASNQSSTYHVDPESDSSSIRVSPGSGPFSLFFTPTAGSNFLSPGPITISHPTVVRAIPNTSPERFESALVKGAVGEIQYLDYATVPKKPIPSDELLHFDNEAVFTVVSMNISTASNGIQVTLEGDPKASYGTSVSMQHDPFQLSCFDRVKENPDLRVLFGSLAWLVATTVAAYKFIKELREG
jgi:hypothetical protein